MARSRSSPTRIEHLLNAPGEGADHAVCVMTVRHQWLNFVDPNWTKSRIIPLFSQDHKQSEPAWNGCIHSNQVPSEDMFKRVKLHFLSLFTVAPNWKWDHDDLHKLGEFLVVAAYWGRRDRRYLTLVEARSALQQADDGTRSHSVWFLNRLISEQRCWKSFGKRFIEDAWPRERRLQTSATSRNFALIAENAEENFPEVVRTILPLLRPVEHMDMIVHGLKGKEGGEDSSLAHNHPASTLALFDRLVPDDRRRLPYDLRSILDAVVKSEPSLRQDPRWRRLNRLIHRE